MNGAVFEQVVGCLLSNANPESVRVRPSRGDGGVDIFVPIETGEIDVYQLKYSRRGIPWRRVEESLAPIRSGSWSGRTIRRWMLTVRQQPTPEQIARLGSFAATVPFRLGWLAEDGLIALDNRFPSVGDYYLRDGRDRLDRLMADWTSALEPVQEGVAPRIDDVQERLSDLTTLLAAHDPHLRYGTAVHPTDVAGQATFPPSAILMSGVVVGENVVFCYAYPAYRGAAADAGDRLGVLLGVDGEARNRVRQLIRLGGEPVMLDHQEIGELSLPRIGHRLPEGGSISVRLTPVGDTSPAAMRLALTHGEKRTIVRVERELHTQGTEGATSFWRSEGGLIALRVQVDTATGHIELGLRQTRDLNGPIAPLVPDLPLIRALSEGDVGVSIAAEIGPLDGEIVPLGVTFFDAALLPVLDALRLIQSHTYDVVTVPEELSARQAADLVRSAALLEGLTTTGDFRGKEMSFVSPRADIESGVGRDVFDGGFAVTMTLTAERSLVLPHQVLTLASDLVFARLLVSAKVARIDAVVEDASGEADPNRVRVVLEAGDTPIWVDRRVRNDTEVDDDLQYELARHTTMIEIPELSAILAER